MAPQALFYSQIMQVLRAVNMRQSRKKMKTATHATNH